MHRDDDLRLAFEVSDLAAKLALEHAAAGVSTTLKADGSPVTEADHAVERLLRGTIAEARPDDALLGEEFGRVGDSQRVWILDPIDGTGFFSRGDPHWRVHVALEVDGVLEVAVVTAPALGTRWWATRGGGAFEAPWPQSATDARRLAVSETASPAEASQGALDDASYARLPPVAVRAPHTPLPLVELVRGELDAFLAERYFVWDHAPWILIVQEAGGRFTDPTGGSAGDRGGGLYSNAALHDALVASVGYPAAAG